MNSWTEELLRAVAIGFLIAAVWLLADALANHRLDDFQPRIVVRQ